MARYDPNYKISQRVHVFLTTSTYAHARDVFENIMLNYASLAKVIIHSLQQMKSSGSFRSSGA